jgi:threonine 3-dehydrogenase
MARLITGGNGFIGAQLAHLLLEKGEEVVIFDIARSSRLNDIRSSLKDIRGDLSNWPQVFNVIKDFSITHIYHLGAVLTFASEENPWSSFQSNVAGTYNVLEAARILNVKKVMFTSSIGTFDLAAESAISDITPQRPGSLYGVGKLYAEGLGKFYRRKFDLDFRSIRFPSVAGPGITTPNHWSGPLIQQAIQGRAVKCDLPLEFGEPVVYFKDAALAAYQVLEAPQENIRTVNYNIAAIPAVSVQTLVKRLQAHLPGLDVSFVKPAVPATYRQPPLWDDSCARREWGWSPQFTDIDLLISDFIRELDLRPDNYPSR